MILNYISVICTLAFLEILLSGDNAIVLAALAHVLPQNQRKKALFYGLVGAFVLRFVAILFAKWIIHFWFLQVIGGLYLLWLGANHLTDQNEKDEKGGHKAKSEKTSFWNVIIAIELTDLAFAVDSVLAAVALSSNLWVIYCGAMIGLIAMRFAASMVLKLLEIFPDLVTYAYIIVVWIGLKLTWMGVGHGFGSYMSTDEIPESIFWTVMAVICLVACLHGFRSHSNAGKRD